MVTNDNSRVVSGKEELEIEKLRIEIAQLEAKSGKDELDREKAELELIELRKRWYRKPQYLLAALPTALAVAGIIAGIASGYFSDKLDQLKGDVTRYEKERDDLKRNNQESGEALRDLDARVKTLNREKDIASKDVDQITKEKDELLATQHALDRQIATLSGDLTRDQGKLQLAQWEFAKLVTDRQKLEEKLSLLETNLLTADMKSLTDLWLGPDKKGGDEEVEEDDDVRKQIVTLFNQRPMRQKQYASFFEAYLSDPKITPEKYISLLNLLLELTKEPKWKKALADLTLAYLRVADTERDKALSALGKIADIESFEDETIEDELQVLVLSELEKGGVSKSAIDSVLWLFFQNPSGATKRGLHRSNPSLYLRVVKIARDRAIESDNYDFRRLRVYASSAFLSVIAYLIQNQKPVDIEKLFAYVARPTRQMKKLEVPATNGRSEWESWANKSTIRRLVELWFEEDFKSFKSDPDLLNKVIEEGDVN